MMDDMAADIIPAGERGSFTISDAQLVVTDAVSLEAFQALLLDEARRRGLLLSMSTDVVTRGITVYWKPEPDIAES